MKKTIVILFVLMLSAEYSYGQNNVTDTPNISNPADSLNNPKGDDKDRITTVKPANSVEVRIEDYSYSPEELTVPVGTKVTWTNYDDVKHDVVSSDKHFESSRLDTNEKYSFTFTEAGSYEYFCSLHKMMKGKIIVK